jgi:hypothetical protein
MDDKALRKAVVELLEDVLDAHGKSAQDERIEPELRDAVRLLKDQKPRTKVGREIMEKYA